ncbi:MAG: hypothetical protein GF419_13890, partial [Ignavibacteriales bacterium]|nr:hypothetical protein [Ignavibacteriales bacterium]
MRYETDELRKYYNRTKRGKAPVAYLTDLVKKTLDEWIKKDKGEGRFRQTGPYWEALYPILEKRAKAKLNAYAEIAGPFNTFNPRVRKEYEYDEELLNVVAAILKMKQREAAKTPTEQPHEIEIRGGAILYTPNEKIGDKAKPKKIEADTKKKTVAVKGNSAPKKATPKKATPKK